MHRNRPDKYGRGSAAANGAGFVDLAPGDTFHGLEQQLRSKINEVYVNNTLGISASIGSNRNANELAKHRAAGESEEVHKFVGDCNRTKSEFVNRPEPFSIPRAAELLAPICESSRLCVKTLSNRIRS